MIPLVVALDNPGSSAQPVEVALALPAGVRVASIEDAPASADPPFWQVNLPAGGGRVLHLQIVLPDQAGSYTVESTIKVELSGSRTAIAVLIAVWERACYELAASS